MNTLKGLLRVLSNKELIDHFDKNNDGVVSWKEIKTAPLSAWIDLGIKIAPHIGYGLLLLL